MFDGWDVVSDTAPRTPGFQLIQIAGRPFAVDSSAAIDAIDPRPPTHVPGTPGWVRGVLLWEGQVVPVVGAAQRLGLEVTAPGRLLQVEIGGEPFFIEVDGIGDVVTDIQLESRDDRLLLGVIHVGSLEVPVLDLKVITDISDEAVSR